MHGVSTGMKEFQDKAGKVELTIFSFHTAVIAVGQIKEQEENKKHANMVNWDLQMQEQRHEGLLCKMSNKERLGQLEGGIFTQK